MERERGRQRRVKKRGRGKQRMSEEEREWDTFKILAEYCEIYWTVFTDTSQEQQGRVVTEWGRRAGQGRRRGVWEMKGRDSWTIINVIKRRNIAVFGPLGAAETQNYHPILSSNGKTVSKELSPMNLSQHQQTMPTRAVTVFQNTASW